VTFVVIAIAGTSFVSAPRTALPYTASKIKLQIHVRFIKIHNRTNQTGNHIARRAGTPLPSGIVSRETDYETNEGARGDNAARKENRQLVRSSGGEKIKSAA
jgi:hypothetical protein